MNPFGHIDLRVRDVAAAEAFYVQLLPALGFAMPAHSERWKCFAAEGSLPRSPYFALTEDPEHQPNGNRIAFWVASRGDVDRVGAIARAAGTQAMEGPAACPEISASYYAAFFEDPSGNRLEVYHRTD